MDRTVLVIDDDKVVAQSITDLLNSNGYKAQYALTGHAAVNMLSKASFSVVLLDLNLPDYYGIELIPLIKQYNQETRIVIITGYPDSRSATDAAHGQVEGYLIKPVIPDKLLEILSGVFGRVDYDEKRTRIFQDFAEAKNKMEELLAIVKAINSQTDSSQLINYVVDKIADLFAISKISVMLVDDNKHELYIKGTSANHLQNLQRLRVPITDDSFAGKVAKSGQPIIIEDVEEDLGRANQSQYKTRSFLCLPIKHQGAMLGVINLTDRLSSDQKFKKNEIEFLAAILQELANTLNNIKTRETLYTLASKDAGTGLDNKAMFIKKIDSELLRIGRTPRPLSMLLLDLDHFKDYNDHFGHIAGDKLLKQVGTALLNTLRAIDTVARYGGEEFIVLLHETSMETALRVAERIRLAIANIAPEIGDHITVSAGIAEYREPWGRDEFIDKADIALYQAKHEGRNRVCIYVDQGLVSCSGTAVPVETTLLDTEPKLIRGILRHHRDTNDGENKDGKDGK